MYIVCKRNNNKIWEIYQRHGVNVSSLSDNDLINLEISIIKQNDTEQRDTLYMGFNEIIDTIVMQRRTVGHRYQLTLNQGHENGTSKIIDRLAL